jgi:hypothetical protein
MTDALTIDDQHVYKVNGRKVRGVTEVLRLVGVTDHDKPWFTDQSRDWGSNLDLCCSMIDTDTLDMESVDDRIRDEVLAYFEWRQRVGGIVIASQLKMYSTIYGVAGTLDVLFRLESGRYPLVDRKRGKADKAARLQTALYAVLAADQLSIPLSLIDRYALDSMGSCRPSVKPFTDRSDIAGALGAVALVNWADCSGLALCGARESQ